MHRDVIFASEACLSVLVARVIMSACLSVVGFKSHPVCRGWYWMARQPLVPDSVGCRCVGKQISPSFSLSFSRSLMSGFQE